MTSQPRIRKKAIITIKIEKIISLLSIRTAREIRPKRANSPAKRKVDNFKKGRLPMIKTAATEPRTIQPLIGSDSGENQDPIFERSVRLESSGTHATSASTEGAKSPPQNPQNLLPAPSLPQIEHSNSVFFPRPFWFFSPFTDSAFPIRTGMTRVKNNPK